MLYILQTGVPDNKRLDKALLTIYGVGNKTGLDCCLQYGLISSAKAKDLRRLHRYQLKSHFDDYPYSLGEDLKHKYKSNCQRLIDIISYRGRRHRGGYPVRGQRTHTNAKTQKRLYKRWLINAYEKPKLIISNKKSSSTLKPKKAKTAKPKQSTKAKPKSSKVSKYKI